MCFLRYFDRKNAPTTEITSFKIKGKETIKNDIVTEFDVIILYCITPIKWQITSPAKVGKSQKYFLCILAESEQNNVKNINPHKNPPVGPNNTCIPP